MGKGESAGLRGPTRGTPGDQIPQFRRLPRHLLRGADSAVVAKVAARCCHRVVQPLLLQLLVHLVVALEVALPAGQQVDMHVWNALPRVRAVLNGNIEGGGAVVGLQGWGEAVGGPPQVLDLLRGQVREAAHDPFRDEQHVPRDDGLEIDDAPAGASMAGGG
eukprot:EG_transcript_28256